MTHPAHESTLFHKLRVYHQQVQVNECGQAVVARGLQTPIWLHSATPCRQVHLGSDVGQTFRKVGRACAGLDGAEEMIGVPRC
jgi:hypothetical protein